MVALTFVRLQSAKFFENRDRIRDWLKTNCSQPYHIIGLDTGPQGTRDRARFGEIWFEGAMDATAFVLTFKEDNDQSIMPD